MISISACRTSSSSDPKTELGPVGNAMVVSQFKKYKNKADHCDSTGSGTRIIFTGFGLFSSPPKNKQNVAYNISGLISRFMATTTTFPSIVNTETTTIADSLSTTNFAAFSHMPADAYGAIITQREITIDQKQVTVCFILLDVIWDQAAAIILYESTLFKPERIIMGGLKAGEKVYGLFEAGAVNNATVLQGFNPDGSPNLNNIPVADTSNDFPILPRGDQGVEQTIAMTWDAKALATFVSPLVESIPRNNQTKIFKVRGEDSARPSNDYICNNISFVILHALKGAVVNLAGGNLRFGPAQTRPAPTSDVEFIEITKELRDSVTSAGFFHYPDTGTDEGRTVFGWSKVLAKTMVFGLQ